MNYYEIKAFSASAIKAGAVSMLNMKSFIESGIDATNAMRCGSLRHMALLEYDRFLNLIVNDANRNTNIFKDLAAKHGKENIVKTAEKEEAEAARMAVLDHPVVIDNNLFIGGETEKEYYWQHEGFGCKAKLDWVGKNAIVEYKTCQSLRRFTANAAGMFYQLQLGWYNWAANKDGKKKFFIVAQESKRPYDVAVFECNPIMLDVWRDDCLKIVKQYLNCEKAGYFPGAYETLVQFELPAWAIGAGELELDDDEVMQF